MTAERVDVNAPLYFAIQKTIQDLFKNSRPQDESSEQQLTDNFIDKEMANVVAKKVASFGD